MEFILSLKPKTKGDINYSHAYAAKYLECLDKVRIMFPNDKDFEPILASSKITWWNRLSLTGKIMLIWGIFALVFILAGLIAAL